MQVLRGWVLATCLLFAGAGSVSAAVTVTGTFQYEDRLYDLQGYTGSAQNLPIRFADVEVVSSPGNVVLATGSTDANGFYSIDLTLGAPLNAYVRCLSSTDNHATYHIKVVDTFVRSGGTVDLGASAIHAIATTAQLLPISGSPSFGTYLIQDATGSGVAQAFNILDNGVDSFDYLNSASGIGRYPTAGEFVVYGWNGTSGSTGSNYFWQGIYIAATAGDTDGWSDTVILHETGHWASDMFGRDDNPGGSHFIGDNNQDPRLSYGEGYATFFCAQVREFRAARLVGGSPVDDHVSVYADLGIPPSLPTPGALEFSYDFETGLFNSGAPIGQIGSANETNVTSALWDLVDGPASPDESPGVDDEPADDTGVLCWAVIQNYLTTLTTSPITIEDFYAGWFATHGAGFMQSSVDSIFVGLAGMTFFADAAEPDNTLGSAPLIAPQSYALLGGGVVINEVDQGAEDKVELYNSGPTAIDLTGWRILTYRNGFPLASSRIYTFPAFILYPGAHVVVHELGSAANNGPVHLFGGTLSIVWSNGDDGACTLEDNLGAPVDFVRWDNVSGSDPSTTPTPPGTGWSGTLFSALGNLNMSRSPEGTDADLSADFTSLAATMGAPNFSTGSAFRTIYPENDVDVVRLDVSPGDVVVVRASAPHSAGNPRLELLDSAGGLLASSFMTHGFAGEAEVQALIPNSTVCYARIRNQSPYTEWAPLNLQFYKRPVGTILAAPPGLLADPANTADLGDQVALTWLNGGVYDSVEVFRNGSPIATLPGASISYVDHADVGLHDYAVRGRIGPAASTAATTVTWAGTIQCSNADGLEVGAGGFELDSPWARTAVLASEGSWSLHDSPGGDYGNSVDASAEFVPPTALHPNQFLTFDHICITEAEYDYGIVELSTDFGNTWAELARYDMDDHPGWNDGSPSAGDWVSESIDLSAYVALNVRVRFRLLTDAYVTEDGWYVDRVAVSDTLCSAITAVTPGDQPSRPSLLTAGPNPFRSNVQFDIRAEVGEALRVHVFAATGRLVRTVFEGGAESPTVRLSWDGRDGSGRAVASGMYLVRVTTATASEVRRVVKLP